MTAGIALREFTLGAVLNAPLAPAAAVGGSAVISTHGTGDMDIGPLSIRHRDFAALGVGGDGFEGGVGIDTAVGAHLLLGDRHGFVVRGGVRADLYGNDAFYSSWLELPQLQVGYQLLRGSLQLEAGLRAGAVLLGLLSLQTVSRDVGGELESGGYVTLRWRAARAEADWAWLPTEASFSSVQRGQLRLCLTLAGLISCLQASTHAARDTRARDDLERWLRLSLTLGFKTDLVR